MKIKKYWRYRRLYALILALVLFSVNSLPGFAGTAKDKTDTKETEEIIVSFEVLDAEIAVQEIQIGSKDEVKLPDTLTARVKYIAEESDTEASPSNSKVNEGIQTASQSDADEADTEEWLVNDLVDAEHEGSDSLAGTENEISVVRWISGPEFNPEVPGTYIFEPVLDSRYILADEVEVPLITVTVRVLERTVLKRSADLAISGGELGRDYQYTENLLTILSGNELMITGESSTDTIEVASGVNANLVLDGLKIDVSGAYQRCALDMSKAADSVITLAAGSENSLSSGGGTACSLYS